MENNQKNNQMVSFKDLMNLFKDNCVYIPLIQRNYKWSADTASKLASDLWNAFTAKQKSYTIGMITFYKNKNENDNKIQLIDGQQRIITLYMILKFLEPDVECFTFEFERDEGISEAGKKRIDYLKNINNCLNWSESIADVERFKNNYCAIKNKMSLDASKKEDFIKYIYENLFFLLHISETEPFDEFMNLNNNKTRFVISDKIKANLMIDAKDKENKEKVLELFRELSESLFAKPEIWQMVNQGYCEGVIPQDKSKRRRDKLYPDENRLKLLCCERYGDGDYDVSGTLGYEFNKEMKILTQYRNILNTLTNDMENGNWNSYNGFNCLYSMEKLRFFELLKDGKFEFIEKYFIEKIKDDSPFHKACFIESQLQNNKIEMDYIQANKTIENSFDSDDEVKKSAWFSSGEKFFDAFVEVYDSYIKQKYQKRTEENNYGVK